jgi:hypothetical protein
MFPGSVGYPCHLFAVIEFKRGTLFLFTTPSLGAELKRSKTPLVYIPLPLLQIEHGV